MKPADAHEVVEPLQQATNRAAQALQVLCRAVARSSKGDRLRPYQAPA